MGRARTSSSSDSPVYITGLGVVCSLGAGVEIVWRNLVNGCVGISTIRAFDAAEFATKVAAQVPSWAIGNSVDISVRRGTRLLEQAAGEAVQDFALRASRTGVAIGANANYIPIGDIARHARSRSGRSLDFDRLGKDWPHLDDRLPRRHADSAVTHVSERIGISGPRITVDTACSAGLYAIAEARRCISTGEADCMIAGGTYSVTNPIGILAFECLGALSRQSEPLLASRPFDRARDGFVMGEAAAVLVLESAASVEAAGRTPLARIAGIGLTLGGATLTAPSEGGAREAKAMRGAMAEAGWRPAEVDAVMAHGTSTPLNDVMETRAIRSALGAYADRVLVTSNKGQIGHTVCAAGACSAVFAALAIRDQVVPPTMGLCEPDTACDLDYVPNTARPVRVRRVLVNSFGFGGQNACLAIDAD